MNKKKILIICVLLLIAIIGAVIAYVMTSKESKDSNNDAKNNSVSSKQTQDVSNKIEDNEKGLYNSAITNAIGDDIKGSEVKRMIDSIILSNAENVNTNGKFISIEAGEITNYDKAADLASACKKANTYEGGKNTQDNISAAQEEIITLRNKLNSGKNYKVTAEYESGVIYKVKVEEK